MTEFHRIQPAKMGDFLNKPAHQYPTLFDQLYIFEDRFKFIEPIIESFIPEEDRFERLRAEAKALEVLYPNPAKHPPLFGILVGVKDIFHADGFITRAGTNVPSEALTGKEASIVTKLKEAGALIAGKTVTTEFAYFEPGPTRNPYNLQHTPGGSSSGSAAAVASGLVHVALGTQTVGSVIRPAAYCGIVGYKPSYRRIDAQGLLYFSRSADHVGLFTQDVEGLKIVAPIVVEDWDTTIQPQNLPVLGIPDGAYLQQSTALDEFEAQVNLLEHAGYTIRRINMLDDIETIDAYHQDMIAAELAIEHAELFAQYEDLYRQRTADLIRKGQTISEERLEECRQHCLSFRDVIEDIMEANQIDLWISPAAPDVAPEGLNATGSPAMNMPWTHIGVPVVTVPAGNGLEDLPLGLQLSARFGYDEALIHWAQEIESVFVIVENDIEEIQPTPIEMEEDEDEDEEEEVYYIDED